MPTPNLLGGFDGVKTAPDRIAFHRCDGSACCSSKGRVHGGIHCSLILPHLTLGLYFL